MEKRKKFIGHILTIKISFLALMNHFEDGVFNENDLDF